MVLDVTAEVGKKVKSAIKAKLMELGAYVDDELPDYIMILVGNKKTKDQMDDDLSLFLGHNTERFTSWLHHVLQKLNAASVLQKDTSTVTPKPTKEKEKESNKEDEDAEKLPEAQPEPVKGTEEKKKHKKKKDKSEKKKEKKEKKKKKDKDREKPSKSHKKDKARSKSKSESPVVGESTTAAGLTAETVTASTSEIKSTTKETCAPPTEVHIKPTAELPERNGTPAALVASVVRDEDDLHDGVVDLRPDADDLALGLEDEPIIKRIKLRTHGIEADTKEKLTSLPTSMELKRIEIKVDNSKPREAIAKARAESSDDEDPAPAPSVHDRLGPLPNRGRSSSPSSKRIINLREESTFPPRSHREGMGRAVSSAIASAVKSVSGVKASDGKPAKKLEARVRPLPSKKIDEETVDDVAPSPVRVVSAVGTVLKRSHNNDDSDENEEPSTKRLAGVASKVEVAPRPRRPGSMQANTALIMRAVADAHKSVNKPSKRGFEEKEKEEERGIKEIFSRSYHERQTQRLGTGANDVKTVKKFAITVPNAERMEIRTADKQTLKDSLIEMEEEYVPEEKIMKQEKVIPQPKAIATSKDLPMVVDDPLRNTRFIVTLDGFGNEVLTPDLRTRLSGRPASTPSIDEEEFTEEIEEWEEEVDEMEGVTPQGDNPERMATTTTAAAAAAAAPKWKTKIDAVGLTSKKEERCRFWPVCKEGAACQFIHPSKVCNMFPSCRFADKCIYIHPNCKFDGACTKPNCPFTHASSRPLALAQPTAPLKPKMIGVAGSKRMMMCRYYPKCVDLNCPFFHPKQICRYGKACLTPNCMYIHPEVTTGSLLKWTAPKQPATTSAASTAAVSATSVAVPAKAPTLTTIAKPKAPISAV